MNLGPRVGTALLSTALVVLLAGTWLLSGALVAHSDPLLVAAGRTGVCAVVLAGCAALRPAHRAGLRALARTPGSIALVAVLALLGFAAYALGTLTAIERIGTSLTNLVVALLPCLSLALGALLFGQRATLRQTAGAALATTAAAGYALGTGGGRPDALGLGLALAGTLAFAGYGFVYRGRLGDVPPAVSLPALLGVATVFLVPFALTAPRATPGQWAGIALLGGVVYAPAYLVQHRLILRCGPVFTAAVQLAVPFLVRLGDWTLGNRGAPSPAELALLCAALAGIALVTMPSRT
ncbi:DMT family transporter [Streptomyces endophyticus]|uniref:DMT family transporter n=1 Tax=Streptomyces endophyticus TaxID=714166 RepID=A0ABU6F682_9ACTN|nr:DMT family transporter [Streptomyces endophyticus]MEB8339509.1 DMT family transporter [Streptomyces endophyticus]